MIQRLLTNPFYLYSLSWTLVLFLYNIKYINIYPDLTFDIFIFLLLTIINSLFLGIVLDRHIKYFIVSEKREDSRLFYFILFGWVLTFLYEGKIPILEALNKTGYMYVDFKGIPTFSPIIWTLTTYHNVRSFSQFLIFKKKKYLFYCIIEIILYLLLCRRGPILIMILLNFLAYINLNKIRYITLKLVAGGVLILYLFGLLGNIRHGFSPTDTTMLKSIINLKTSNSIFDPFLWGYIYITSPLSNLQYTFDCKNISYNILEFLRTGFLFDFIAKRLETEQVNEIKLLIENFNVQTGYNLSLMNLGIIGMCVIYIFYSVSTYIYIYMMRKTTYLLEVLCLLSGVNIFFIFTNMYTNSALGITVLYPLIMQVKSIILKRREEK